MPDEEVTTAVADTPVEPGPSTGSEAEDEGTKLEELVTEGEVGAEPEQEAEAEKPEPEQEAEQETSFADALEAAKPALEELKESDPEQYERLGKLLGGDEHVLCEERHEAVERLCLDAPRRRLHLVT